MPRTGTEVDGGLGDLEPGTTQRAELRDRLSDIAWTAPTVLLALWAVWATVSTVRGSSAWVWCAVAWVLAAVALTLRALANRRREQGPRAVD